MSMSKNIPAKKTAHFYPDTPLGTRPTSPAPRTNNRPDESHTKGNRWCFTLNNYSEEDETRLKVFAMDHCDYMIYSREVGEQEGTEHLQGYMETKNRMLGQTVKNKAKVLRMWMCPANGTAQDNIDYCTKQYDAAEMDDAKEHGEVFEYGAPRPPVEVAKKKGSAKGGKATKALWTSLNDAVNTGKSENEIKNMFPQVYYKHHSGIKSGIAVANRECRRSWKTCVHWIYGPAGVGKTTEAQGLAGPNAYWFNSPNQKLWFTGYDGVSPVVLDDFDGSQYPLGELLTMMDQYPHKVPVHGGLINFAPRLIIITSNKLPGECYNEKVFGTHRYAALMRRINSLIYIHADGKREDVTKTKNCWKDGCLCPTENLAATQELPVPEETADEVLASLNQLQDSDYEEFALSPVVLKSKRKIPEPLDGEEETKPAPLVKKRKLVPVPPKKNFVKVKIPPKTTGLKPKISPNVPLHQRLRRNDAKMDIIPGSESEDSIEELQDSIDNDSSEGVSIFEVNDSEDSEPEDISEDMGGTDLSE